MFLNTRVHVILLLLGLITVGQLFVLQQLYESLDGSYVQPVLLLVGLVLGDRLCDSGKAVLKLSQADRVRIVRTARALFAAAILATAAALWLVAAATQPDAEEFLLFCASAVGLGAFALFLNTTITIDKTLNQERRPVA